MHGIQNAVSLWEECVPHFGGMGGGGEQSTKNEEETGRNEQCIHERVLKL